MINANRRLKLEDIPDIVRSLLRDSATAEALDAWTNHCVAFCTFESGLRLVNGDDIRGRLTKWWTIVKHVDINNELPPIL